MTQSWEFSFRSILERLLKKIEPETGPASPGIKERLVASSDDEKYRLPACDEAYYWGWNTCAHL